MRRTLSAFLFATPLFAAQNPTVAHVKFDETTGLTASDSGPLGNHGTLINFGAAPWVGGRYGNALAFDGVDDYVHIATPNGLPIYDALGTPFSICFWVNAPAQSDRRVYSEQAAAPTGGGPLFTLGSGSGTAQNATGRLRVFLRNDEVISVVNVLSNRIVFDGTWHHVAYVDVSGRAQVWIDGTLDMVVDYSRWAYGPRSSLRGSYAQINSVTLGAVVRNGTVATPLLGLVDDLRIYRSALSSADVGAILGNGTPTLCAASIGEYGYGCGRGPLDLAATGSAAFGNTLFVQLLRGEPGALALASIGIGRVQPIDLTGFGFPACTLYQLPLTTLAIGALGAAGSSAPLPISIPANASLRCLMLGVQGISAGTAVEFSAVGLAQLGY